MSKLVNSLHSRDDAGVPKRQTLTTSELLSIVNTQLTNGLRVWIISAEERGVTLLDRTNESWDAFSAQGRLKAVDLLSSQSKYHLITCFK